MSEKLKKVEVDTYHLIEDGEMLYLQEVEALVEQTKEEVPDSDWVIVHIPNLNIYRGEH